MKDKLFNELKSLETDLDGALYRLSGDKNMYAILLDAFVEDPTMQELDDALKSESWDSAFTAAHAMKGLAGNMGFTPLFHHLAELVIIIRKGRISEIPESYKAVRRCYDALISAIVNCRNSEGEEQ